jgi:hypothetical protein
MQYNQPYGVSDPNAPYINGNPSTGTAGSIPPAASIEFPQREIVNLITDAGLAASNSDLHQLAKGVQSGQLIFGVDVGVVNQVSIPVTPPVTALKAGMTFLTVFAHDNTAPATASVSGLPFVPIVHPVDRSPLNPLELRAGAIGLLAFDGTNFQLAWSNVVSTTAPTDGQAIFLSADQTYYVGGPGASDSNDGTSATVTTAPHGPFATLQKAMNTIANFNLNGHNIFIYVYSPGTYAGVRLGRLAGSGQVSWIGSPSTPGNVVLTGNGESAIIGQNCGPCHVFDGFALQTSGAYTNDGMWGANISGTGTIVSLYDIQFNACSGGHLAITQAAVVGFGKQWIIAGNPQGANPGAPQGWHIMCNDGGIIQPDSGHLPQLSIPVLAGGLNGGGFITASILSFAEMYFGSMSGKGNYSGIPYQVQMNSIITTHGGGGGYLPGNLTPIQGTGGQYT